MGEAAVGPVAAETLKVVPAQPRDPEDSAERSVRSQRADQHEALELGALEGQKRS